MDPFRQIDGYCERLSPAFWAEPVNAVTNLAFIAAAVWVFREARRADAIDGALLLLMGLTVLVGIGSFLFHTFATVWAALADVIPITLFIFAYLAVAMRRFVGLPVWGALAAVPVFMVFSWAIGEGIGGLVHERFRGSVSYLPALCALLLVGAFLSAVRRHPAGRWLLGGAALFAVSLTFRTLDLPLCGSFPLGTHFLWHVLNGALLGLLIMAVVRHGRSRRAAAA